MSRLLVVGLISLLAGQALVLFMLAAAPEPPPPPPATTACVAETAPKPLPRVMVAARQIDPGNEITNEDLSWVSWPEQALNPTLITETSAAAATVQGMAVRGGFFPGEPIITEKLVPRGKGSALSFLLGPGMRAATIPIDETTGNAGLIRPGDRVDLILVLTLEKDSQGSTISAGETVLEDMKVIAVDQTFRPGPLEKSGTPRTVTVEGTPRQVNAIALAQQMGRVILAVRAHGKMPSPVAGPGHMATPPEPEMPLWGADVAHGLAPFLRRALPIKPPDLLSAAMTPPPTQTAAAAAKPTVLVIRGKESKIQQIDGTVLSESGSVVPPPSPPTP